MGTQPSFLPIWNINKPEQSIKKEISFFSNHFFQNHDYFLLLSEYSKRIVNVLFFLTILMVLVKFEE